MRTLKAEEIEIRVGATSANKPKAMLLLYKDARCDMAVLDELFGPENWQSRYEKIDGVLYCSIGVFNESIGQWVFKQSNGIESQGTGDDDPNNKKGEASDAFKRAGFMWGIGRELYEWKDLWIDYDKQKDKYERFRVTKIAYDGNGQPKDLIIVNSKNKIVYKLENGYYKKDKGEVEEEPVEEIKVEPQGEKQPKTEETKKVVDTETLENEVKQENIVIWKELIIAAQKIYQSEGFTEGVDKLAKEAPMNYFVDELKIPTTKLELTKTDRKPKISGNVVVVADDEWLKDYKAFVFSNAEIPF
jgi:hypothetical protein